MKKIMMMVSACAACWAANAALVGMELKAGATAPMEAGRVVAAQAIGWEAGSIATIKRVTPYEYVEYATATVTNYTYRPATSNVQYTATETLWRAWATNAYAVATGNVVGVTYVTNTATVVTGTVWSASTGLSNLTHTVTNVVALTNTVPLVRTGITSNLLAQAWGERPYVAGWSTNDLLYTSQSVTHALSSNVTYQVVDTMDVRTETTRSVEYKPVTNTIWSVEMESGELKGTNGLDAVMFKGDILVGEGSIYPGGKVQLLIER